MKLNNLRQNLQSFFENTFVPREVFFRSGDRFHHLRITARTQKLAAAVSALAIGWTLYASGGYVVQHFVLSSKQAEIERQRLAYFDLLAEVGEYHEQFSRITQGLEENQAYLMSVLEKSPEGRKELAKAQDQLKDSATAHARVVIAREGLRTKMQQFENDLREIAGRNIALQAQVDKMRTVIEASKAERDEVDKARARLNQRLVEAERELADADTRHEAMQDRVANLQEALRQANDTGAELDRQRDYLERRVAGLEQRLIDLRDAGQSVIGRLSEQTRLTTDMIEKTVEMTGLDVTALLEASPDGGLGQGGPFVPAADAAAFEPSLQLEASVSGLDQQLDRWSALQDIVRSLPLAAPLDQYRISSRFGERHDPLNGRKAKHLGLDFAGPVGRPVYATAPGKVVFAGWRGRYGRVVEIDHGYGIRTRFAHLRKILVKAGQEVGNRDKIALLGSSGRSTGPHVHYEVRYKGQAQNPLKFLKAGNHVFKG